MNLSTNACSTRASLLGTVPIVPYSGKSSPYYKYNPPVSGQIAIVAANPYLSTALQDDSVYAGIRDCGFNVINIFHSISDFDKVLSQLNHYGLKALLYHSHMLNTDVSIDDEEAYKRCINTIKLYKDNIALGGWYFKNIPSYDDIVANGARSMKKFYDLIKETDPYHLVHINLIGYEDNTYLDGKSYLNYMDSYQTNFLPGLWSYEMYPISVKDGQINVNRNLFYLDLERYAFRRRILQRPFWAYCQSQGMNSASKEYPSPTLPYLRYVVFSALGYGAQGIVYSNYHQSNDSTSTTYFDAPVDKNGNHTDTWGNVQKLNQEISAFNEVFCGCQQLNCLHTVNQYEGTCLLDENCTFGPFSKIESEVGGMGIQISHLNTNGEDYIVIVNHDVERQQTIKLNKEYFTVKKLSISASGVGLEEIEVPAYSEHTLSKGGYLIFKFY